MEPPVKQDENKSCAPCLSFGRHGWWVMGGKETEYGSLAKGRKSCLVVLLSCFNVHCSLETWSLLNPGLSLVLVPITSLISIHFFLQSIQFHSISYISTFCFAKLLFSFQFHNFFNINTLQLNSHLFSKYIRSIYRRNFSEKN